MRLKHVPEAESIIQASPLCIKEPTANKGQWNMSFSNNRPINIEIGMGKGKFLIGMADEHPDINFIGIEKYSSVLYKAVGKITDEENIRFICNDASLIADFFEKNEVEKIYLNFSDPWPKARHEKRRLTSHRFLDVYEKVLQAGGKLEFKTDNVDLFDYSYESIIAKEGWKVIAKTHDLWNDSELFPGNITTEYEEKFAAKGQKICKLIAVFEGE